MLKGSSLNRRVKMCGVIESIDLALYEEMNFKEGEMEE